MPVRSFTGFRPSPRYDDVPWDRVQIGESATQGGTYSIIDTQDLDPLDADPARPVPRNITTDNAVLQTGWYQLTFLDATDNEDPADPVQYPGHGYPSPAEVVAESSLDALTALAYEDQEALWLSAKLAIEEFCAQTFTFEEATEKVFDGRGGRTVYLPKRLEVLDSLEVTGSGLDDTMVRISSNNDALHIRADAGLSNYYVRAMYEIQGSQPLCFTYGTDTITVTGDWGWSEFPQAVRDSLRLDMEDNALSDTNSLSQTLRAYRKLGLRDVSQGGLSASLGPPSTLSDRVMRLLDGYVWQGAVGVSV